MTEYPYRRAAFINAIADEGSKAEAVEWLQKQWNENCYLREEVARLKHDIERSMANHNADLNSVVPEDGELALLRRAHAEISRWKSCQRLGTCRNCADDGFLLQLGLFLERHKQSLLLRTTESDS